MQVKKTWVLVANGSIARIFELQKSKLIEHTVLSHPETRLHGRDLVADKPGSAFSSNGSGRSAMEPRVSPQQNEVEHFALKVAQYLNAERRKGTFNYLHMVAAPSFLGSLRQKLEPECLKILGSEVNKDLVDENPLQIRSYLP